MLFNSFEFLIFFPTVTAIYFLLPQRFRWLHLLIASCVFYMFFIPAYILILAVTILIDYTAGIYIERSTGARKRSLLIMSIFSTVAVLFVFKYFNFFNANFAAIAELLNWNYPIGTLEILLPIGLSFHTFQSLAYVIEVYREKQKAERHLGIYALYVMFYPQLVAGPIERPQNMLHQFRIHHKFEYKRVTDGLKLMAWGMFKKVVIADRLAAIVDPIYSSPGDYSAGTLILATVFFAFQIYCDFSGYSDIAIGSAQVMGFKLMDNFRRPYFSKSISEFWKRWHISLSTWFKDYVYISLGGSRVSKLRWVFNIMVVFLISGFWHGANWTFVLWGAVNGLYLLIGRFTEAARENLARVIGLTRAPLLRNVVKVGVTFGLVCFAWIFFRAESIGDAWFIIGQVFVGLKEIAVMVVQMDVRSLAHGLLDPSYGLRNENVMVAVGAILFMELVHLLQRKGSMRQMLSAQPLAVRWAVYYCVVFAVLIFGVFSRQQFIYFQF